VEPGVSDQTITSGDQERVYELTIPEGYDGVTPLPLVFGLHALTISYTFVAPLGGFADMAQQYDFIAVSPSGLLDGGTVPYWLAAPTEENYDLQFFNDLLDQLEADLCIDTSQVFSLGMSNGGQMSSLLACEMPERITAVAPIAGVEFYDECKAGPVPVMAFHGSIDPIVTYDGGGLNAKTISNTYYWKGDVPDDVPDNPGVDESMRIWAEHNGCDPEPTEEQVSNEVRRLTWNNCQAATVLYVVDGGGHAWPGKPQPQFEAQFGHGTTEIDATSLMFEFFFGPPAG